MACCSSDCFVYFVLSVALAFMAVSTTLRSPPDSDMTTPSRPITHHLSLNASNALSRSSFKAITTLLHISPEIFLSSSPNTTLFAIDDSALYNTSSLPPLFLKQILQYHTIPLRLPMKDLLKKPQGTCLPTLLRHKSVEISTVDKESRTAEVNHVRISHPDMFLGDSLVIHGVLGPFSPLQPHYILQSSLCQSDTNTTSVEEEEEEVPVKIDWIRIVQLLSSNGFVPFAIGLHSVLNRIVAEQHKNLTGVTILATPNLVSLSSASPLLYETLRHHILAQRLTYKDFASMPDKASIKTLDPYQDLIITRRRDVAVNTSGEFMISGVEIIAPDMFSSSNFVIHGISHTLEIPRP